MTTPKANVGLLVPLSAKFDTSTAVADFLESGYKLVQNEPETLQWFGVKYAANALDVQPIPDTFAIFDTFHTDSGRSAHLNGEVAKALMSIVPHVNGTVAEKLPDNTPALLSVAPSIDKVNILASVIRSPDGRGFEEKTAGLSVGLKVLCVAKENKVDAVKHFLRTALPTVETESGTLVWYAIEFPGSNMFGIVDFFATEDARNAHLTGEVGKALFASAEDLLVSVPDVVKLDVIAAKI